MAVQARREDSELLARIAQGDYQAFPLLLRPYEQTLFLVARMLCANDREAEVLAQQSVLAAFRELTYVPKNACLRVWLARIVVREAGAAVSASADNESADYSPRDFGSWQEIPAQALENPDMRHILMRETARLPIMSRLILVMRDVEKFTDDEVAWILGMEPDLIRKKLLCARLQMRDALAAGMNSNWRESGNHPSRSVMGKNDEMRRNLA